MKYGARHLWGKWFRTKCLSCPKKIYLYQVDKNQQTTSRLWIHSGMSKRSLIQQAIKIYTKICIWEFSCCVWIYIDELILYVYMYMYVQRSKHEFHVQILSLILASGCGMCILFSILYFVHFNLWIMMKLKYRVKCFKSDL